MRQRREVLIAIGIHLYNTGGIKAVMLLAVGKQCLAGSSEHALTL